MTIVLSTSPKVDALNKLGTDSNWKMKILNTQCLKGLSLSELQKSGTICQMRLENLTRTTVLSQNSQKQVI